MRYAIVTETYPPEVNGVALTVQGLELGLRAAGHQVDLVRPRQPCDADAAEGTVLVSGASLPRYPGLRFGLPAPSRLSRQWQQQRPDAIYIATEGPLGWSALRTARRLGIPVAPGFHTRFDEYLPDYGVAWLQAAALRWMRRFHNQADATLVPTQELQQFLGEQGFDRVRLLARAVDSSQFEPERRDPAKPWLLAPHDLQAVKAAGVTFAISMLERVIEERARGNPSSAEAIRKEVVHLVGDDLSKLKPGSAQAMKLKQVLIDQNAFTGTSPTLRRYTVLPSFLGTVRFR